jgi:hypothetical protein
MRPVPVYAAFCLGVVVMAGASSRVAAESRTASLSVTAEFRARTSLKLSNQLLQFEASGDGSDAIAVVDFSAGARTRSGGEVVLTVEPVGGTSGPGGAADVETAVTFSGTGDGMLAGALRSLSPSVVGRWTGSGLRTGRVNFALRAAAAGTYTVPVRFVLSTP